LWQGRVYGCFSSEISKKNFIGIDVKGSRIWSGAKESQEKKLTNVGFLRTRIDLIQKYFSKNEIDEIWITFPDPQLKRSRLKKRLTHPKFLKLYNQILKPNSVIHLKTDNQFLHGFTLGVIAGEGHLLMDSTNDLYSSEVERDNLDIKTYYEKIFLSKGMPITYLKFILNY
jgi:tRNA (guanine-N7-)-methyltransferase